MKGGSSHYWYGSVLWTLLAARAHAYGKYDPCNPPGAAARGGGFFLGLAFWPGGTVEDWGPVLNSTTNAFGLHPCNVTPNYTDVGLSPAAYLESKGVSVAAFEVKVDSLMALSINITDLNALINSTSTVSSTPYVSMIAFRGPFRSEAVYIYSNVAGATQATGHVTSLSLILQFSKGMLSYLQWSDFSCNTCGGQMSSSCLVTKQVPPQRSCPVPAGQCINVTDCSLSIFGAFSGSDRHSLPLNTGLQLAKIGQFALSTYFFNALEQLTRLKQAISSNAQLGGTSTPATAGGDAA